MIPRCVATKSIKFVLWDGEAGEGIEDLRSPGADQRDGEPALSREWTGLGFEIRLAAHRSLVVSRDFVGRIPLRSIYFGDSHLGETRGCIRLSRDSCRVSSL